MFCSFIYPLECVVGRGYEKHVPWHIESFVCLCVRSCAHSLVRSGWHRSNRAHMLSRAHSLAAYLKPVEACARASVFAVPCPRAHGRSGWNRRSGAGLVHKPPDAQPRPNRAPPFRSSVLFFLSTINTPRLGATCPARHRESPHLVAVSCSEVCPLSALTTDICDRTDLGTRVAFLYGLKIGGLIFFFFFK